MKDEKESTALVKYEPHLPEPAQPMLPERRPLTLREVTQAYIIEKCEDATRKREELGDALRAGRVRDPFSIGTLISIGVSLAASAATSPLTRALAPRKAK